MNNKDTINGTNIVKDNIETMVNNGDVTYKASPCVVMNNLVQNHNGMADEMGDATAFNSSAKPQGGAEASLLRNIPLKSNFENEEKIYKEPVDYETAFGEYYPDQQIDTENAVHQRKK